MTIEEESKRVVLNYVEALNQGDLDGLKVLLAEDAEIQGVLVGGMHLALKRNPSAATVLFLAVVSHWLLDLLVRSPDLALVPGSDVRVDLGLWLRFCC